MSQLTRKLCAAFLLAAALAEPAAAQREAPGAFDRGPSPYAPGPKFINQPGKFDYYVLALSWSPSYCAELSRNAYDPQCHRRDGRRYAFVLHGLWPQFERGWPQDCPSPDRGFVPRPVAQRMLDIMPSEKLVFHEYRKHGVCSGLGVDGYFDLARRMYTSVKIPTRYQGLNDARLFLSPNEVIADFVAANPKLTPDMIAVECGGSGPRLKEVRICFEKSGDTRACGRNEDQKRLCSASRIYVPPVREAAPSAPDARPLQPPTSRSRDERRI